SPWEQRLWRWYDATAWAANLSNCPTIAYAGELDPQRQASEIMERALAAEGLTLERFTGPQTAHKYHPETRDTLAARLATLAAQGRDPLPRSVWLTTYTLRYPEVAWVRAEGLQQHWERAEVRARRTDDGSVTVTTRNVTALTLTLPALRDVTVDGQAFPSPAPASFHLVGG